MSDNHVAVGERIRVAGSDALSSSKSAGYLHHIGGFVGVIAEDIRGTSDAFYTGAVKGFTVEDGVGDGIGDIQIEGVFALIAASGVGFSVGDAAFADISTNRVSATTSDELAGWIVPQEDGTASRAASSDDPSWMQAAILAGGEVIVHVKLAGFPKAGLV